MESSKKADLPENPRESAGPLSNLFFLYTLPLFFKGNKKDLTINDLYKALNEHKSSTLGDKLCKSWEKELELQALKNKKPSLMRATIRVFGWQIALLGIILLILELCIKIHQPLFLGRVVMFYSNITVAQPLFLGGLVAYYSRLDGNITEAYLYAAAVVLCSALNVVFVHPYMLSQVHCGMKLRVAMISMIYRKALRLSKTALGNTTAGQIVNLLSNDVGRLDLSMIFFHHLWVGPVEALVILYLMYQQIGVSAVPGVIFMLLFIPIQGILGKKTSVLRLKIAIRTDERVRLMNEIVQGIQVIKMYAWEKPFGRLSALVRKREIKMIRYTSYIRGLILSFIIFVTRTSVFMSLVVYALLGFTVSAEKAFTVTAYYMILRQTMTVFFPQGIAQLAETLVSVRRIEEYMLYSETKLKTANDDNEDEATSETETITEKGELSNSEKTDTYNPPEVGSVKLTDVSAKWDLEVAENTLTNVSFSAKPGELLAVIGPVGAGKSSLIQVLLGELPIDSGKIEMSGKVSFASQEPWLFTGTVRQNILFGQPMDRRRYKMVVKKCALERDFDLLPFGDRTVVGERGASLSGGQKARISLARAVYRKAGIYLLDDPLSAVDTHVGKHLFEQCMRDYLREHIVILVTHQLQFLQHADKIIILEHGKISAIGTYSELRDTGLDFANLLSDPEKEQSIVDDQDPTNLKAHNRQNSESSVNSAEDQQVVDTQMQVQEMQSFGSIGLELYKKYFKAGGGLLTFCLLFSFCLLTQLLASGCDFYVSLWVAKAGLDSAKLQNSTDSLKAESGATSSDASNSDNLMNIYIFTGIICGLVIVTLIRSFLFFTVAMRASRKLHDTMYQGVTRAAMYFFNTNPSGRILNRFSKDMGQVDEILPAVMMDVIQIFFTLSGILVVVIVVNIWFLIPTAIMGVIFYNLRIFYLSTSRNVKRMEAVTRSPIYSHLSASLTGLSTIRAFGAQNVLIQEFDNHQDIHSSVFFAFISTSRAFGFWLDCVCVLYIATVTVSFFVMGSENGGNVGLAITQALGMTGMVQWGMRQSAELENTMTSVERVVEYDSIEPEGDLDSPAERRPSKSWPDKGHIKFHELSLRYFPDPTSENVLKNLNIEIMPQEKIGIVGRTGAGKSSLINALFRLSYNEGSVIIDGIDTNTIGLHDLRTKISIIPQEPVLFSGTMRYNLDPFDEYSDGKLWQVLEEVKLKEAVTDLPFGLQSKISEGGRNFSVGQRQLVCLARAILRENRILVMDEATANVDPQTDALIQTTIRDKFNKCTVLTIAHRLHTVMDSDRVLVMDAGRAVEFDAPYILLTEAETKVFHGMAQQTGKATFKNLLMVAKKAYEENEAKRKSLVND